MKPFAYEVPRTAADAVAAVATNDEAMFLGGGTNLVDHLRLGIAAPDVLVDVRSLTSSEILDQDGGLRIGASVRNSDLAADPRVRSRYPVLAQALLSGASGQLRNMATVGGNLMQRTRCPYFQDVTTPCNKRSPGSGCSALGGATRNHAVLGASEHCVATHPSDFAVALAVLGAQVDVLGPDGERTVPFADLHRLPGDRPDLDTTLAHGELITAVTLAGPGAPRSAYRKVRDRASYAFALVSVAAVVELADGTVTDIRLAFGGVAHKPWRATAAEDLLRGKHVDVLGVRAAVDAELRDARTLDGIDGGNGFKPALLARTTAAVLRDLIGETR